jgi:voltage-gated sodium channel
VIQTLQNNLIKLNQNKLFELIIISVIVTSALLIGVKTYDIPETYLQVLSLFDFSITLFFLTEIILRFLGTEQKKYFFTNAWNIFDTTIVVISLLPLDESEFAFLARLIRIFRVLRLISVIPDLRILMGALIKALPAMGYVLLLMFILFYIYAAVGSFMFEAINPVLWGDIAISMLTLFRVVTFEDWTDVMYETMVIYPFSWAYYLSFIFFNAFVFLNMMIGIIIDKMQQEHEAIDLEEHTGQAQTLLDINERLEKIEVILRKKIN